MSLLETEALVLRTYNLAEADKIVVCLTRRVGLIRAVAKGCRRLKNRFGAALEPFTLINVSCYQKEHQDLISLRQAEILKSNFSLFGNPEMLTALAYMADLVIEFSPPYQPNEKLFRMVKACIEAIESSPSDLPAVLRYFEIWLLKLEGFLPDFNHCANCQKTFEAADAAYVGVDVTLYCSPCSAGKGYLLSKRLHAQLRSTHKLAPAAFAAGARELPGKIQREMAEFTHQIIGRVLEKQPRVRLTMK